MSFEEPSIKENLEYKKILVIIAGPLINLIIMLISIVLNLHTNIIYTNLMILLLNLIPIYPLDGGRLLKCILKLKLNNKRVFGVLNKISNITIIILTIIISILVLYIHNIVMLLGLGYLWYIVIIENKRYKIMNKIYEVIEKDEKRAKLD